MSKHKWITLVSVYSIIYTIITLLNSVLYLCNGIYEDPSCGGTGFTTVLRQSRRNWPTNTTSGGWRSTGTATSVSCLGGKCS